MKVDEECSFSDFAKLVVPMEIAPLARVVAADCTVAVVGIVAARKVAARTGVAGRAAAHKDAADRVAAH